MSAVIGVVCIFYGVAALFVWLGASHQARHPASEPTNVGCFAAVAFLLGLLALGCDWLVNHLAWVP